MKTLLDINENQTAKIVKLDTTDPHLKCRFYELGLITGQSVKVIKVASKKSAMLVCVRGFTLALDKDTCAMVIVDG